MNRKINTKLNLKKKITSRLTGHIVCINLGLHSYQRSNLNNNLKQTFRKLLLLKLEEEKKT